MKSNQEIKNYREMNTADLQKEADKVETEIRKTRLDIAAKKSDKSSDCRKKRVTLARINTILNEKLYQNEG